MLKIKIFAFLLNVSFPGLGGVPIAQVIRFFYTQLIREAISIRSSASAYSFFLALFPALIFIFTLIPYIPVENLRDEVLNMMKSYMPSNVFETIEITLTDILDNRRGNLLSVGFILTLYFASNGINRLLVAFNRQLKRSWWKKYLISIALT
ncbi:YihY/virulence factor BrkB family protein, partial [Bacteroidota bacterium]